MLDYFYTIFSETCVNLLDWVPMVFVLWFVFDMIHGLLFKD